MRGARTVQSPRSRARTTKPALPEQQLLGREPAENADATVSVPIGKLSFAVQPQFPLRRRNAEFWIIFAIWESRMYTLLPYLAAVTAASTDTTPPTPLESTRTWDPRRTSSPFSDALHEHGMGIVLDIVPNHMAASSENSWWMDVLENGSVSRLSLRILISTGVPHRAAWKGKFFFPCLAGRSVKFSTPANSE